MLLVFITKSNAQIQSQPSKEDQINSKSSLICQVLKKRAAPKRNYNQWYPNHIYIRKDSLISTKYQCWGTTAKGLRCKRSVKYDHGFCSQHQNQNEQDINKRGGKLNKDFDVSGEVNTIPKEGD